MKVQLGYTLVYTKLYLKYDFYGLLDQGYGGIYPGSNYEYTLDIP